MNNRHNMMGWVSGAMLSVWQNVHGNDILTFIASLNYEAAIRAGFSALVLGFIGSMGQEAARRIFKRVSRK